MTHRTSSRQEPQTSDTSPEGCPGCRYRSTSRRSSGRTSSDLRPRAPRSSPRSPNRERGCCWRSVPGAPSRGYGTSPPAYPTAPAVSRRCRESPGSARWHRTRPSCELPCPGHRRPPARRGSQPLRDRDCSSGSEAQPPEAIPWCEAAFPGGRAPDVVQTFELLAAGCRQAYPYGDTARRGQCKVILILNAKTTENLDQGVGAYGG